MYIYFLGFLCLYDSTEIDVKGGEREEMIGSKGPQVRFEPGPLRQGAVPVSHEYIYRYTFLNNTSTDLLERCRMTVLCLLKTI